MYEQLTSSVHTGYLYGTCRLGLVADQRRGFRGDNGRVAQSVLCRLCHPLVHLRF